MLRLSNQIHSALTYGERWQKRARLVHNARESARLKITPMIHTSLPLALHAPTPELPMRPVRAADLAELCATCWAERGEARAREALERILEMNNLDRGQGLVALDSDTRRIVAYGQVSRWARCSEISDLYVVEAMRGRGMGTALIQHLVRAAYAQENDCVEIGAALSNPRALALYRRLGFRDAYNLSLNLGAGSEPVVYLRLHFADYAQVPWFSDASP